MSAEMYLPGSCVTQELAMTTDRHEVHAVAPGGGPAAVAVGLDALLQR